MNYKLSLLNLYLQLLQYYQAIYRAIFSVIGEINIVYEWNETKGWSNETLKYYLGLGCRSGIFSMKKLRARSTDYYLINGPRALLSHVDPDRLRKAKTRKQIILLKNEQPISFDLNILDRYYQSMIEESVCNLKLILSSMNVKCDSVKVIDLVNKEIKTFGIESLTIDKLYQNEHSN